MPPTTLLPRLISHRKETQSCNGLYVILPRLHGTKRTTRSLTTCASGTSHGCDCWINTRSLQTRQSCSTFDQLYTRPYRACIGNLFLSEKNGMAIACPQGLISALGTLHIQALKHKPARLLACTSLPFPPVPFTDLRSNPETSAHVLIRNDVPVVLFFNRPADLNTFRRLKEGVAVGRKMNVFYCTVPLPSFLIPTG